MTLCYSRDMKITDNQIKEIIAKITPDRPWCDEWSSIVSDLTKEQAIEIITAEGNAMDKSRFAHL